jgi:hypothetical protein
MCYVVTRKLTVKKATILKLYEMPLQVKVKVKVALELATKAQKWSRGIALLFL